MRQHEEPDGRHTILVVEDSSSVRRMICAMLEQNGYNCLEAGDGVEALRVLDEGNEVVLVLTDVIMPNMDGAELARHLARTRPSLRILFMSGYVEDSVLRPLGKTGSLFLAKPFTAALLQEKIQQALDVPWIGLQRAGFSSA
ncbi:MAG TPA: response regulator [Bryobacteraceae bacterium]|nr:response regulator [Bryobacteraceae bacterium]